MSEDFWNEVEALASTREANVETWFVIPLLLALGHKRRCIDAQAPVVFQEGRNARPGRKPAADFVVYAEQPFGRATSLIVVESKRTDEPLDEGREQGESYAQNLRAPILLMTNGRQLEIWQIQVTTESIPVLRCDVSNLAGRRGEIEALLSRDAIKAHCATIEFKRFDLLARDLGGYEHAAHDRVDPVARSATSRRLRDRSTGRAVGLDDVLALPRGASIVGSSGYGKTTLAASLMRETLERRWEGKATTLPIDVFLPALAFSGMSVEAFAAARIAAHKPGFTPASLAALVRDDGFMLVADGFDRVPPDRRDDVKAMLGTLLRDHPRLQLVVLSRANVAPIDIGLPILHLEDYSRAELLGLAAKREATHPNAANAFFRAPDYIYRIAEVPLLADLLLDRYERARAHPVRIAALYDEWLERILSASRPFDRALDRALMERIAGETATGAIAIGRAIELAEPRTDPEAILNRLADADAISLREATVELRHEALADYLRASRFWKSASGAEGDALSRLTFDPASQFAMLLVDMAPTGTLRGEAWLAVARADLRLAMHTLRFAAGDETFGVGAASDEAARFLGDIRTTIETLSSTHFGPIADRLHAEMVGEPAGRLGIEGMVDAEHVNYSFVEATGTAPVSVGLSRDRLRMYGHTLRRVGYGPEAGRIFGVQRLRDALHELIASRDLEGGRVWTEEKVFGRLRHIDQSIGTSFTGRGLREVHTLLTPHVDGVFSSGGFSSGQPFSVRGLLDDIASLMAMGATDIPVWWDDLDRLDLDTAEGRDRFARTLDEYHRRRQIAYSEVVDRSLPALRPHLPTLRMMPLRMEIEVELVAGPDRQRPSLRHRRWPVGGYEEAGADVAFPSERSDHHSEAAVRSYIDRTDALLARFGRSFPDRIILSGGSIIPDLRGEDTAFGGLPDESAVVRGAMKWLKEDVDRLFSDVPGFPPMPRS